MTKTQVQEASAHGHTVGIPHVETEDTRRPGCWDGFPNGPDVQDKGRIQGREQGRSFQRGRTAFQAKPLSEAGHSPPSSRPSTWAQAAARAVLSPAGKNICIHSPDQHSQIA